MRPYPTMLPQSANSAGREAALPAALRGLSHRTARPEGSQCEAEKVAVRGRRGRSAKPKRSQCESEEVAVRVRRGRSASPKMSQCESENVAVRTPRTRTAVGLRPHCSYAVRPRGLALRKSSAARMLRSATCVGWCYTATAWVGARTLPTPTREGAEKKREECPLTAPAPLRAA